MRVERPRCAFHYPRGGTNPFKSDCEPLSHHVAFRSRKRFFIWFPVAEHISQNIVKFLEWKQSRGTRERAKMPVMCDVRLGNFQTLLVQQKFAANWSSPHFLKFMRPRIFNLQQEGRILKIFPLARITLFQMTLWGNVEANIPWFDSKL